MAFGLTRFDPIRDIARFDPFSNFDDLVRDFALGRRPDAGAAPSHIRINVVESEQGFAVSADMPGLSKEDIKVSIDGNLVSLAAEFKQEKSEEVDNCLCRERVSGQISRSFTLPQDVDEAKAQARYDNGVLHLSLPKRAGGARHKLTVQ
ncbi:heat-shock protein Hsp20 [Duganella caerulea]|uniref:Hsp20/alpha crystallin family protein n=1 Tax=Duganella caerulea TaxID=2885762 RepID=UPI0030E9D0D1